MGSIKTSKLIRSVYINEALDEYLQDLADSQQRTVSQVLSRFIEQHIKNNTRDGGVDTNGSDQ